MTNVPSENATIVLYYDEKYRQQVIEKDSPDSWINIGITAEGTYLWNMEYGVTGFACGIVLQFIDSVCTTISEDRCIIELEYGPSWITVEPQNYQSVNVVMCSTIAGARNPDKRLDIDTSLVVTKQGWVDAVIEMAHEFRQTVLDLNPELHDHTTIKEIHQKTKRAETLVKEEFDADQQPPS